MRTNDLLDDNFTLNVPKLDLHGEIRSSAKVLVKEFIYDNYVMKNKRIIIIHGIGTGAIKDEVQRELKENKYVLSYHLNHYNVGATMVFLKSKN